MKGASTNCKYCGRHERASTRDGLRERLATHLRSCQGFAAVTVKALTATGETSLNKSEAITALCQRWVPEFTEAEA